MLHDNALSNLYQQIIEAILLIFKSLGTRSSQYVNQVIPQMIQITENCKQERREFFLRQFGVLASIIQHQLQPYIKSIFELIHVSFFLGLEKIYISVLESLEVEFFRQSTCQRRICNDRSGKSNGT